MVKFLNLLIKLFKGVRLNMPRVTIQDVEEPYQMVDAVASVALKEPHKKYGNWMRELASIVHAYYTPEYKGSWQGLWTIATRAFSFGYRGYSLDNAIGVLRQLAAEFNVDIPDLDRFIASCYELGTRYGEKRAKRAKTE